MQIGHSMIIYWYTEEGALPTQVPHGSITSEALYTRLPPSVRDEARRLLATHQPSEVAEMLSSKMNYSVPPRAAAQSGESSLVDGGAIDVSHTEEVAQGVSPRKSMRQFPPVPGGHQLREDAVWKCAKEAFDASDNDAVFDAIWRMLLDKNEARLLQNIKSDFGIEIIADHHPIMVEGEPMEAMVVTEEGLVPAEIVDERLIPEGATIENVEIVEENVVIEEEQQQEGESSETVEEHVVEEQVVDENMVEEHVVEEHTETHEEQQEEDDHPTGNIVAVCR
ncbi:unnamed protein product, partial [Cylicostephanus goldi]